jgi:hypothetical protein
MPHGKVFFARRVMLACFLFAGLCNAAPAAFNGPWAGTVATGPSLVRVTATQRGEMIRLHFGEPYRCRAPAELLDASESVTRYRFTPSSSGGTFCERLYPGVLAVAKEGAALSISFDRQGSRWSGVLKPAATAE